MTKSNNSLGFISSKISYLKQAGLVAGQSNGRGMNGGACPDWLKEQQEERRKKYEKARKRQRAFA